MAAKTAHNMAPAIAVAAGGQCAAESQAAGPITMAATTAITTTASTGRSTATFNGLIVRAVGILNRDSDAQEDCAVWVNLVDLRHLRY